MKKFLGILAIAGVLVACDNSASSEQRTKDSLDSVKKADSLNNLTPAPSIDTTTKVGDTSTRVGGDTSTKVGGDTATKL